MKNYIVLILVVLSLLGCSTRTVETQGYLPIMNNSGKASYAWLEGSNHGNDIRVNNPTIDTMVQQSVNRYLRKLGYVRASNENPDFLVSWFGSIEEEVKEIALALFYSRSGYSTLIGPKPEGEVKNGKIKKVFSRGTLILDVIDAEDNKIVWRGSATNTLQEGMSQGQIQQYIDTSIAKILEDLPRQ